MVDGGPDLLVETAFTQVVDDADDLPHGVRRKTGVPDLLADGVFAWEVFFGKSLVDDENFRLGRVLGVGKESATDQASLQRREVAGADFALVHLVVLAGPGMPLNSDPGGVSVAGDGQAGGDRRRLDSGQPVHCSEKLAFELDLLLRLGVGLVRRGNFESREMVRRESELDVKQMVEAARDQAGSREKHNGNGQLEHNQVRSEAAPDGSRRAATALGEVGAKIRR